jgi:hypothetical protein
MSHAFSRKDEPMSCRDVIGWRGVGLRASATILLALSAGCGGGGGGGGTSVSAPSALAAPDYSGSWQGTTGNVDQNTGAHNPIVFAVQGGQVTTLTVHVDINVPPDSVTLLPGGRRFFCTYVFSSTAAAAISGNAFSVPVASTAEGFSYRTTVTGTFQSTTTAQGRIEDVPVAGIACRGTVALYSPPVTEWQTTWSATRSAP